MIPPERDSERFQAICRNARDAARIRATRRFFHRDRYRVLRAAVRWQRVVRYG
jgi:hypothetical protein